MLPGMRTVRVRACRGRRRGPGDGAATRRRAAVCLLLASASLAALVSGTLRAEPAGQASPTLNVMSFNIRYGTADDGDDSWQHRRDAVIEVIEAFRVDVLGLQEALHFQLEELAEALPRYRRVGVGRDDGIESGEYAAILYDAARFEAVEQGTFWFSEQPEEPGSTSWGNDIPRICTWARLRDAESGRAFYVYNVHWDHRSQPSRERSAELLLERIEERGAPQDPVIVTGDFNAGEDNPAFRALLRSTAAPLADTFREVRPDAADVGTFNGFEGATEGDKIDAVLASPQWAVMAADIVRSTRDGRYPSDHFPVIATLLLR